MTRVSLCHGPVKGFVLFSGGPASRVHLSVKRHESAIGEVPVFVGATLQPVRPLSEILDVIQNLVEPPNVGYIHHEGDK
jgi:hypothetical protein